MKWVDIISLRCPANIDIPFVDELLRGISESEIDRSQKRYTGEERG